MNSMVMASLSLVPSCVRAVHIDRPLLVQSLRGIVGAVAACVVCRAPESTPRRVRACAVICQWAAIFGRRQFELLMPPILTAK